MVVGAAKVIAAGGVDAMSLRDLAVQAGVPLGSTYHHFPDGKAQLVDEAVRLVGGQVTQLIEEAHDAGDRDRAARLRRPVAADPRVQWVRRRLPGRRGRGRDRSPPHEVAREVFADWHAAITRGCSNPGYPASGPGGWR